MGENEFISWSYIFQSFTKAEELISAQFPVAGAAIDLVRLLIDEDCSFLVCLNPMSEVKEVGHRPSILFIDVVSAQFDRCSLIIIFLAN